MEIGVKVTLKQLKGGLKDLERIASVATDNGDVNYAVGRTVSQAKAAIDDLQAAAEKLFDRFKQPVLDPKTGKVVDYHIPVTKQRQHNVIMKKMMDVEVELYGYTFTVAEATEHFKPTGNEFGSLLGWLIRPDKPKEKEAGYKAPNFDMFLEGLDQEGEKEQVAVSLVNGSASVGPAVHPVD